MPVMWQRICSKTHVSAMCAVRRAPHRGQRLNTSRSRCCSPTSSIRWTSPRPSARSVCARSWQNWSAAQRIDRPAIRRHHRQVHRRRHHGAVRGAGGAGGPRFSGMCCGVGDPGGDGQAGCRPQSRRRNRSFTANRPEFRSGHRRRIGFGRHRLTPRSARRSEWRSGWNRQRHQAGSWSASRPRGWWTPPWCSPRPSWFTSRAPTRPCLRGGCWRRRNVGTSADRNRRLCSGAPGR